MRRLARAFGLQGPKSLLARLGSRLVTSRENVSGEGRNRTGDTTIFRDTPIERCD